MWFAVSLFLAAVVMVPPSSAADSQAMVVGRVYHVEGDLLRYIPEENDWVAVVRDAPFGAVDTLYSGSRGMAELIVPNGTWIRVGNNTQIQFIALDTDLAEMDVASGVARFYNKSSDTVVKVTSPFGYVLGDPGTVFDFYVGENSVEAVAIKGKVDFIHAETDARYEVSAGSPSLLADQRQVSSGEGNVDYDWNRWNTVRENFWAAKSRVRGGSAEYLPPSLRDEAYALEENGRWEDVSYEGERRRFWRPTTVALGWSPFTVGRWTDWYGDQTWIPAEPFGYVTHHYGNWIYVRNYWYWAPPVVSVRFGLPLLDIGFFWYPGRVSWIHSGAYVGWVPLAPRETYYSHRYWGGPHDVVVTNVNIAQININLSNYAYVNRTVVVPQNDFYRVNNYRDVRVKNINRTTIVNNYRVAPVVNNTVINNYATNKQRYNYTNVTVKEKPHNTVINRIQHNETVIQGGRKEKAAVVQERVKSIPEGRVNREARIEAPKVTNYIVPVREVNRPKAEIKFPQREVKTGGKLGQPEQPAARPERVAPAKPNEQKKAVQPAVPARVSPVKPAQPEQPAARPERAAPAKPNEQKKAVQPAVPERVSPVKPVQPEQPAARPERVVPAKPNEQKKAVQPAVPVRVSPVKPAQPEQPAARPERAAPAKPNEQKKAVQPAVPARVSPVKPAQPEQPAAQPEHAAPAKPNEQKKAVQPAVPERVSPVKPAQPEQPAVRPERAAPAKPNEQKKAVQPAVPVRVSPIKPAQPEQPAARPERVAPAKPNEQKKAVQPAVPVRVSPVKPAQPEQPAARP
jgi:hypothetical protein